MTQKRTPARRKATGNRDTTTGPSASVPHNWPDTGTMPKPERVPTGSGERKRTRLVGPRTRGQVRRRASGERTKGRPQGRMDARRASRKSLPEPVAVEAARPVPRGRGRSNASPLPDLEPVAAGQLSLMSSPDTVMLTPASGFGAGPASTEPSAALYRLPWHGQEMTPPSILLTVQPWWVQIAVNALKSPCLGWVTTIF